MVPFFRMASGVVSPHACLLLIFSSVWRRILTWENQHCRKTLSIAPG